MRVQCQGAPLNVRKLVKLSRVSHVDFHSGFGTVFQGVLWVFTLRPHGARASQVERELVERLYGSQSAFIRAYQRSSDISHVSCSTPWSAALATSGSDSAWLEYVLCITLLVYVATVAGLLVVRNKRPETPRHSRVPLSPVLPVV